MQAQGRNRKRPLRTALRLSLAKQQAEEQFKKAAGAWKTGSEINSSLIPLPALEINAQDEESSFTDSDFQLPNSVPLDGMQLVEIPILKHIDHTWSQSAPDDFVSFEVCNSSNFEVDEQLDDIVSSIENDLAATFSTGSHVSLGSISEGSYRGGRRKEPPPSDMTDEYRVVWEQERRRKDAHNDIEKRRREKIKDHIEELRTLVPGSFDIGDQPNSTSEILEATLKYVEKLKSSQQEMAALCIKVEELQKTQRKLLLHRQMLLNAISISEAEVNGSVVQTSNPDITK